MYSRSHRNILPSLDSDKLEKFALKKRSSRHKMLISIAILISSVRASSIFTDGRGAKRQQSVFVPSVQTEPVDDKTVRIKRKRSSPQSVFSSVEEAAMFDLNRPDFLEPNPFYERELPSFVPVSGQAREAGGLGENGNISILN